MMEQLAVWYLARRGRVVLPRFFIGFAVGFATAVKQKGADTNTYDVWQIDVPKHCDIIALNNSLVVDPSKTKFTVSPS